MGLMPYTAAPMPTPTIESSASGESMIRLGPYLSNSPSVARNTPPRGPTSSPVMNTHSSRASSSSIAWRMASMRVISGMISLRRIHRAKSAFHRRVRRGFGKLMRVVHFGGNFGFVFVVQRRRENPLPFERCFEQQNRIAFLPLGHFFARAIRTIVVVGRMRHGAIGFGLDQSRPPARTGARDGVHHRFVAGQHIVSIHHHA